MFLSWLRKAVAFSARKPWTVVAISLLFVALSLGWTATHFDMSTDTGELISEQTEWRKAETELSKAFPGADEGVAIIVDGKTPELAEGGAARLTEALNADRKNFVSARRAEGGDFLRRNGLLFASLQEVRDTTSKLIDAQPMLGPMAFDPTLRGIAKSLSTAAGGVADDPADPQAKRLEAPLAKLHTALSEALAGKPAWFSWQKLFAPEKGNLAPQARQVVLVRPELDFDELQPGARAVAAIRDHAGQLGLDEAHGVTVKITGEVPLADEEFGSIEENIGLVGLLMAASMLLALWFATRSAKTVTAIAATIVAGLLITLGAGLLAAGKLTLISIAFIPLFVGLGVDFGIQVSVRFNAERRAGAAPAEALDRAASAIGAPVLLAAGAICLALGAFLPTDYVGIAGLGVISALGMAVALVLNLTLLPALLMLLQPPAPAKEVGFSQAAPIDRWLERNRRPVLLAFVGAMLISIASLPFVQFDFNPLNLRNPETPAMKGLRDLLRDEDRTPNTLSVLAPNPDAARTLAEKLGKLPEVRDAVTLDSMIPEGQPEKLALIEDAAFLLDATINPFDLAPPADDAQSQAELRHAAAEMRRLAASRQDGLGKSAGDLAGDLDRLAEASPEQRQQVETMLVEPLNVTLNQMRLSLQATTVDRASLPPEVTGQWIAKDGRALVLLIPKGNSAENRVLERFTEAVRKVTPDAVGMPVSTQEAARTVSHAFVQAGILALILVSLLLFVVLRSVREVAYTLAPVVLSGFLTLGSCVAIGQPLNFANIIAFPLLFGVGVAFHIYFVMAWWAGGTNLLQSSLARAVLFSALATGAAFGALWFSHHPGTASMGLILMISLIWTLVCALIFEPALLGPQRDRQGKGAAPVR
ncbi:MAG: MMPL family transporter [Novosphingobium sp.]